MVDAVAERLSVGTSTVVATGPHLPREFATNRTGKLEVRPLVVRPDVDAAAVGPLLDRIAAVDWDDLVHAYGPAVDVPGQLAAVVLGDEPTREEAWWNLWGNIHHQGTIYEATVPAVPILVALAGRRDDPDRTDALMMLREIAAAEGVYVWRSGADEDEPVTLEAEQDRLLPVLRAAVADGADELLTGWRAEPEPVRRALLWLLTALPDHRARHQDLVDAVLPAEHRAAWATATGEGPGSQEDADAVYALEDWVGGA